MKKRLASALIAGGLFAAMLPGMAAAAAPVATGTVHGAMAPGGLLECPRKDWTSDPADPTGPGDVIQQTRAKLQEFQATPGCGGSWASVTFNGHEIDFYR